MVSALVADAAAVTVVRIISLFLSLKVCKDERFAVEMRSHSAALKTGGSESDAAAATTISEMPGFALLHTARFSVRFVQPLSLSPGSTTINYITKTKLPGELLPLMPHSHR